MNNDTVKKNLENIRISNNLSQGEMAFALGIARNTYRNIEKGSTRLISDTVMKVAEWAGMTPEELYKGYLWMYRKIYSFKNIIKRIPEKRDQRAAYLMFNFFYRKFGKLTDLICKMISYERIGLWGETMSKYMEP